MKVEANERSCPLSGRIYVTIDYWTENDETLESLALIVSARHGECTEREVIYKHGYYGYRIRITKSGKK